MYVCMSSPHKAIFSVSLLPSPSSSPTLLLSPPRSVMASELQGTAAAFIVFSVESLALLDAGAGLFRVTVNIEENPGSQAC